MFSASPLVALAMQLPGKVAFTVLGLQIYWYGIFLAVGVLAAIVLAHLECKRRGMPEDTAVDLCLIALPCGIVGARIVYVLLHLSAYLANPVMILRIWDGGLSLLGAVLFALAGIFIYANKKKTRFLKLLDVLAPCVTLALVFGSWGSFFNQEFYGPIVTAKALKWFPLCVRLDNGEIHLALFFLSFVWLSLTFVYLWFRLKKRAKHDGDVTFAFLLLFGFSLAILSALRKDPGSFTVNMIVGAVLFVATLLFLLVRALHERRTGTLIWPSPEEAAPAEETEESEDASEEPAEEEEPAAEEEEAAAVDQEAETDASDVPEASDDDAKAGADE